MQIDVTDEHWANIASFLPFDDRRDLFVLCRASVESPARRAFFEQCAWRMPSIEWLASQVLSTLSMKHVVKRAVINFSWQQAYLAELTALESVRVGYNSRENTFEISRLLPVGLKNLTLEKYYNSVSVAALARLVDLEELSIVARRIDHVEVVGTLSRLRNLTFGTRDDPGADLEWVGDLARLCGLRLTGMYVKPNMRLPLDALETLDMHCCKLTTFDFLMEAAPRLTSLVWNIWDMPDTILESKKRQVFLRSLAKIETLRVTGSSLVNPLSMIFNLTTLKTLELRVRTFDDLSPLANFVHLEELILYASNADWSPIAQCKKLRVIDQGSEFDEQNESSARALQQLPLLRTVNASFRLCPEYPLLQITSLEVGGSTGKTCVFEPDCCPNIEVLSISYEKVDIQSVVDNFPLLKELSLYFDGPNADVGSLSQLTRLERLSLTFGQRIVEDISFLLGMTHLKELFLHNTKVPEFSALRNLKQLQSLLIEGDSTKDISVVAELKQLRTLRVFGEPVRDLTCLYDHPRLHEVHLSQCAICSPLARDYGGSLPIMTVFWHANCAECVLPFWHGYEDP